jgi:hypothetical protein
MPMKDGASNVILHGTGRPQTRIQEQAIGMAERRSIAAFENNSKPMRRQSCVDSDFSDFSGLRGSVERDRTTAEWDWPPDEVARSNSLWNWVSGRVP